MNHNQELRFFKTDNLFVLTQNKIATRFLKESLDVESYDVDVNIDDKGEFSFHCDENIREDLYKIINSENKIDCLMLIRHPEKRMSTGLVQDILDNFMGLVDSPFLYKYLSDYFGKSTTYEFIEMFKRIYLHKTAWNDKNAYDEFEYEFNLHKEEDLFSIIFEKIFELYITVWGDLNIWQRGHNNPYLFSFYEIYKKNKDIKVIDLDENKEDFNSYLNSFGYRTVYEKRSNTKFKQILESLFSKNQHLYRKLSTVVIERDLYFYTYLKDKV